MPMIRAMRLLNAIEAGTTTGAQLQTLLTADPGRLAEFNVLLGMRGQMRRMAASSTAMTAVAASSTAMTAVAASSTARLAVHASDTALTAISGSATAIASIKAAATYVINSTAPVVGSAITTTLSGKYIMVGWSDSLANTTTTITGRRAGSTVGTLAGASIAVGATAATNNVMALESPVTVKIDTTTTTVYLGVLPV